MSDLTIIDGATEAANGALAAPEIDPKSVEVDSVGFCSRQLRVRLPVGFTLDNIKEAHIWRKVQAAGSLALRKLDKVQLVEYDENWVAEAIVAGATETGAVLGKPVVHQLPPRREFLLNDENYAVTWVGNGYRVRRKRDNAFVTPHAATKAIAERDLRNLYSRPAA